MGEIAKALEKDAKARWKEIDGEDQEELPPVDSLMFSEVERRIDVVIFHACLAPITRRGWLCMDRCYLTGKRYAVVVFCTPPQLTHQ
jgi:hypothetical protein